MSPRMNFAVISNPDAVTNYVLKPSADEAEEQPPRPELPLAKDDSDESISSLFVSQFGHRHRYVSDGKYWLTWNERMWSAVSQAQSIHDDLRLMLAQLAKQRIATPDKIVDLILGRLSNINQINNIIRHLQHRSELITYQHLIDANPQVVVFENCAFDTEKGAIMRHESEIMPLLQTKSMPVWYSEKATCPSWEAFLNTIFCHDAELISFVQMAAALSLSGTVAEEYLFFAYGSGRNGKTTFFTVLEKMFGEYHKTVDSSVLMSSKLDKSNSNMAAIAQLKGIRFATANEMEEKCSFSDKEVKLLSSRDKIVGRLLYSNPSEFTPSHKLWVRSNHKPTFNIDDAGLKRRIVLIPFRYAIPEKDQQERFEDFLLKEKSGILNWLMEGWLLYQENGLQIPAACRDEMDIYLQENDHLARFIDECCLISCTDRTLLKDFSAAYAHWARQGGYQEFNSTKLSHQLRTKSFSVTNGTGNRTTIIGLKLATDAVFSDEQVTPSDAES